MKSNERNFDPTNHHKIPKHDYLINEMEIMSFYHQIHLKPFNPSKSLSYSSKNLSRSEWPSSLAISLAVLPYKHEKKMKELEIDLTLLSLKNGSALASIHSFVTSI